MADNPKWDRPDAATKNDGDTWRDEKGTVFYIYTYKGRKIWRKRGRGIYATGPKICMECTQPFKDWCKLNTFYLA